MSVDAVESYRQSCISAKKRKRMIPKPSRHPAARRPNRSLKKASGKFLKNAHHHLLPTTRIRNLSLGRPDVLEETVTLSKSVQSIVALAHGANETGESIDDVLALDGPAVLVDLGDGDLARTVVLGLDDAARRRALAGDVKIDDLSLVVLHGCDLVMSAAKRRVWVALRCRRGQDWQNFKSLEFRSVLE